MGLCCLIDSLGWLWWWYWRFEVFYAVSSIILAFFNVTIGLRRAYVKGLIAVFGWARKRCAHSGVYMEESMDDFVATKKRSESRNRHVETPEGYGSLIAKCRAAALDDSAMDVKDISFDDVAEDVMDFAKWGIEVIVKDEVTNCFNVEELPCWNLLTRTDRGYAFVSWRIIFLWLFGVALRCLILFVAGLLVFWIFLGVFCELIVRW